MGREKRRASSKWLNLCEAGYSLENVGFLLKEITCIDMPDFLNIFRGLVEIEMHSKALGVKL